MRTLADCHPNRFCRIVMTDFTAKKGQKVKHMEGQTDTGRLYKVRSYPARNEQIGLPPIAHRNRYNQDREEWLDRMRFYRQIQTVKHILAVGKQLNERKGKNNDTDIRQTAR
jgi:hypothetical protein